MTVHTHLFTKRYFMSHYGSVEYWNERYTKKADSFEWYNQYSSFKELINKYMDKEYEILNVGCGNSNLSEDIYRDGYTNITSCDFSPVVISKMQEECEGKHGMHWDVEDVHNLTYQDNRFDVVIDKGTLDAIICGDEGVCDPDKVLSEICRVLKPTGVYICITYGAPEFRLDYLQKLPWKVTHTPLPKTVDSTTASHTEEKDCHHIYFCRKSE